MKNITLAIDEELLREARRIASERNTSVNALVRDYLSELVARKARTKDLLKRLRKLSKEGGMVVGPITWSRDDIHER
jgi:hypothetical protein